MKGFRKICGVNWLKEEGPIKVMGSNNCCYTLGQESKLPFHWQKVRNILLINNKQ